jgi:type IV pilus assembly protein PilC
MMSQHYLVLFGVIVALVMGVKFWRRTKSGAYLMDAMRLRMPIFGILFRKAAIARFSRTLGTLMASGVPVLQALNIVRETAGNQVVAKAIQQVHDSVKEGDTMAEPLAASKVFPDIVVGMVDVGEETGALPEMLIKIAEAYDDEVDTTVEGLTSVIEPLMIVFLAVIVGVIVIAMFLPLIKIIERMTV